ncbi:MAG: DUF4157 domain-containing protein [Clostridia bacterium]|nr:DUF4157 domain-containing protein [Clostridia bacterium]
MNHIYDNRKQAQRPAQLKETTAQQPSPEALRSGAVKPTREQMGHRVDLPDAMRAKMENAFGADFSAVRLYESRAVADAGAGAMTQGTNIAFAPGLLDFTSFSGQALLGHELSHVVSQSRGEARGSGFLNDPALEAKADREGALAASGQTVAAPTASLSPVSAAPAASPMQAGFKKPKTNQNAQQANAAPQSGPAPSTGTPSQSFPAPQSAEPSVSGSVPHGSIASHAGSASSSGTASQTGSASSSGTASQTGSASSSGSASQTGSALLSGSSSASASVPQGSAASHAGSASSSGTASQTGSASSSGTASQTGSALLSGSSSASASAPQGGAAPQAGSPPPESIRTVSTTVPQTGAPQNAQASNPGPWQFTSSPNEQHALPTNGIGFLLGMENLDHPDPRHRNAFMGVLRGMKGISVVSGNRRYLGGQAAYDAMIGNAYQGAIDGLVKYREVLKQEFLENARYMSNAQSNRFLAHAQLVNDLIRRARYDQKTNMQRRSTTLSRSELVGAGGHGAINQVHKFERGPDGNKETAFFKPSLPDSQRTQFSLNVEHSVMDRIGIRHHDAQGRALNTRLSKREIAYSRLSSLMGSSVGIGAKLANYEGGQQGVLMEEAKGKSWDKYNWQYFGPAADTTYTCLDPAVAGTPHPGANWGERLGSTQIVRKSTKDQKYVQGTMGIKDSAQELDAADPDYQRQMNEMFLLDTLATHTDRHAGNYHVNRDENGKISVKTMDNDITFGSLGSEQADQTAFGKRGQSFNYGGLPAKMQIDANMATKIKGMKKEMLYKAFSDVLSKDEIESLWSRFEMMKEYVGKMEKEHLIVDQWNEETAKRETSLAGGAMSHEREDARRPGGYAGNNYYQRQMLMLHAADSPYVGNGEDFLKLAEGRTWGVKHNKDIGTGLEPSVQGIATLPEEEDDDKRRSL